MRRLRQIGGGAETGRDELSAWSDGIFCAEAPGFRAREPFATRPRLNPRSLRTARMRRHGGGWVGVKMSLYKFAAGLVALALSAAVVTALAGAGPEPKADRPPDAKAAVAPDPQTEAVPDGKADRAPAAATGERPVVRAVKPGLAAVNWACPREPWPYGCQWREPPARKVIRGSRPS